MEASSTICTAEGYKRLGERFAEKAVELIKIGAGYSPDAGKWLRLFFRNGHGPA